MPHTIQQIRQLLGQAGISPRHVWGQNFLIDLNLMRLLVDSADLKGNETVLEVGTGTGSLTDLLAQGAARVITVDIDQGLSDIAREQLADHKNISFYCTDVLANKSTINLDVMEAVRRKRSELNGPFYLIANLPYNIASPLIINLLLGSDIPDAIIVTIQDEVAQRMIARPSVKAFGQLSIIMQATGAVNKIRTLNPQSFWPQPKVKSAMIAWHRDMDKCNAIKDITQLKYITNLLLGHRRKTIKSCLAGSLPPDKLAGLLQRCDVDSGARAETLEVQKFVELANQFGSTRG